MYIEYLSISNLFSIIFKYSLLKLVNDEKINLFYFEASYLAKKIIKIINFFYILKIKELEYELKDVKDNKGELIRIRIFRKDLFEIRENILKNNFFLKNLKKDSEKSTYYNFLIKSITEGHLVMDPESLVRAIFIIQVVLWHSKKYQSKNPIFFIGDRFWFKELKEYSNFFKVNLKKVPQLLKFYKKNNLYFFDLRKSNFPLINHIYNIIKKIIRFKNPFLSNNYNDPKIYSNRLGHFNLDNNGFHSDLFFVFNSNLKTQDVICEYSSLNQLRKLKLKNFTISNEKIKLTTNFSPQLKKVKFNKKNFNNIEYNFFKKNLNEFNAIKRKHYMYAKLNNIKIYLTWSKFVKDSLAIREAMNELGGILAIWEYAFEGHINTTTQIDTDLYFSNFSYDYFHSNNSTIDYFINTGFLTDFRFNILKKEAMKTRLSLKENGAKYIIAIFDENSNDYKKWHTGHSLQIENYEFILNELMKNDSLGVIFKPKNAKTLRNRIGKINKLLLEAESTGRCFVYESFTDNFTSAPPVLAGLSADLCIHSHLSAGTAAIECALANLPTLLIDREGSPNNILYSLLDKNIIYNNWQDAISAINSHFQSKIKNDTFGIWPEDFLYSLDNFRDGKAAFRMGEYLKTMIDLIKLNKNKNDVLLISAEKYAEKYGKDKVRINI